MKPIIFWTFDKLPVLYRIAVRVCLGSELLLNIVIFLCRFIIGCIGFFDITRSFVVFGMTATLTVHLVRNIMTYLHLNFGRILSLGQQREMNQIKLFQQVTILVRILTSGAELFCFLLLIMITTCVAILSCLAVRFYAIVPKVILSTLCVFICAGIYMAMTMCGFGAFVHESSLALIRKFKSGVSLLSTQGEKELSKWVKSLQPIPLPIGVNDMRFFNLDKDHRSFVLESIAEYSIDSMVASE